MKTLLMGLLLALAGGAALAQEAGSGPRDIPPPPPMPEENSPTDLPPPSVTIRREDGKVVEEYSFGGVVYMVHVSPDDGPDYYLMDFDGDGVLEKSDLSLAPNMLIPHWVIFDWK